MKKPWNKALAALTAAAFAMLAAPTSAQVSTTANGPYYATPSWDQKLTTNRFVILANWNGEAVLDRETGLVWERSPDTTLRDRRNAHAHCIGLAKGARTGWRLPRIQELLSLNDPAVASPGPTLPVGHPFGNVQTPLAGGYMSATAPTSDNFVWYMDFGAGIAAVNPDGPGYFVWCVRGGYGTDIQ
jgi:hypothetical protein